MIRVAVAGAAGRMGETVCAAVDGAADMELVGRADPLLGVDARGGARATCRGGGRLHAARTRRSATRSPACGAGVHVVIGTTGFDLGARCGRPAAGGAGARTCSIAPNFAIGAVLMMRFAAEAARHMAKAEIIELHHDGKLDAPSGTAARTAAADGGARAAARRRRSTRCACPGWSPTRR